MKIQYLIFVLTLLASNVSGQNNNNYAIAFNSNEIVSTSAEIDLVETNHYKNPFAGKTYRIDNYIGEKLDNSEDLVFTDTHVEGSICVQYGFEKAAYNVWENGKDQPSFSCTMISQEHGKMVWEGVLKGKKISGKYLWTKEGQAPINYTFVGKIK